MDDDDPAVTVRFGAATYTAAEGGGVIVTVRLSAAPERRSVTIPITRSEEDGATSGDYSGVPPSVGIQRDGDEQDVHVQGRPGQRRRRRGGRGAGLRGAAWRVNPGSQTTSTVRITDDDDPAVAVRFGQAAYAAAEGGQRHRDGGAERGPGAQRHDPADEEQPGRGNGRRLLGGTRERGIRRQGDEQDVHLQRD